MKPSHIAYIVVDRSDKNPNGFKREVGEVWPHKSGNGFDVVGHGQFRIVCFERKDLPDAYPTGLGEAALADTIYRENLRNKPE
jgi:hypothetical protein